uniref:GIY-YIG catalytic domain protein n=1 Tax=Pithovirus LCPAC202 TaxID=2506592 RepID=A0A481Z6Q5_9VIRU|nr:MAG: GIY-YIG catalytic domain protein [Pithovirus LCPAC202]
MKSRKNRRKYRKGGGTKTAKRTTKMNNAGDNYTWFVKTTSTQLEQIINLNSNLERINQRHRLCLITDRHNYCYLLRSMSRPRRTYFGVTLNLSTRIRQHNGEITGGAKATRSGRPWKIIAYISGFISRIEALRFEWRVHHPGIRWSGLKGRIKAISKVITEQKWLLGPKYGDRNLTISWMDECDQNISHLQLSPAVRLRCIERHTLDRVPSG